MKEHLRTGHNKSESEVDFIYDRYEKERRGEIAGRARTGCDQCGLYFVAHYITKHMAACKKSEGKCPECNKSFSR